MPDQLKGEVKTVVDANTPQQSPSPALPPAVEVHKDGEAGNDETKRNHFDKTYIKPKHWTKYAEAICAIALVFITIYYTRAAYRQAAASETASNAAKDAVGVASNTLKETQRSNARQEGIADENRASSEADSEKAIKATQDAMRLDQRAWVSATSISGVPELDKPFILQIIARNTGKTFAKQFKMTVVFDKVVPPDKTPDFSAEIVGGVSRSVSLLSPSGEYTSIDPIADEGGTRSLVPTQDYLDKIKAGGVHIFVFGRMEYSDIFHTAHWSTFCYDLTQKITWRACSEHNDADDN